MGLLVVIPRQTPCQYHQGCEHHNRREEWPYGVPRLVADGRLQEGGVWFHYGLQTGRIVVRRGIRGIFCLRDSGSDQIKHYMD